MIYQLGENTHQTRDSTQNRGHSNYQDQTKQLIVKSERETVPVQSSNQSNSTCQPAYTPDP